MSSKELPPGWRAGKSVDRDLVYAGPPPQRDPSRLVIYGAIDDGHGIRLYDLPAEVSIAEIVEFFEVGSHGAMSYGYDEAETTRKVAAVVSQVVRLVPAQPYYADSAGLKLRFRRKLTEPDLQQIEALFPDDEAMQLGMDGYISDWDGESRMLEPIMEKGTLELWWD